MIVTYSIFFKISILVIGLVKFMSLWNHILLLLIMMEVIALNVFFSFNSMLPLNLEIFNILFFISILVCSSTYGFSVFIFYIRTLGIEYMSWLSLMKC